MSIERRALTVGINDYADPTANLAGCRNDALDWGQALYERGHTVSTLLDGNATRERFLDLLTEEVARLGYRDRLVVTYSGHGTRVPDRGGDEADGWDEAIVLADMQLVTDDDFAAVFSARAYGSRVVFVSDSCHAGTLNRVGSFSSGPVAATYDAEHTPRRRFLPAAQFGLIDARGDGPPTDAPRRSLMARSDALFVAAALPHEYAWDAWFQADPASPWRANGAFTRHALDVLNASAPDDYDTWVDRMPLPDPSYPQTPNLDGTWRQTRWPIFD